MGGLIVIFGLVVLLAVFLIHYPITPFSSTANSGQSTNAPIQTFATPLQNITDITASTESDNNSGYLIIGAMLAFIVLIAALIGYSVYRERENQGGRQ